MTKKLNDYVEGMLLRGKPVQQIQTALASVGWPAKKINDALKGYKDDPALNMAVPVPGVNTSSRQIFINLFYFIAFIFLIGYLMNTAFALVNYYVPENRYSVRRFYRTVRDNLSAIIVILPALYFAAYLYKKSQAKDCRNISSFRINIIYALYLAAAGFLLGYLMLIVRDLLNYTVTANTLVKFGVSLVMAGAGYKFFLPELKAEAEHTKEVSYDV